MGCHPGRQLLWHPLLWTCSRSCCPCCPCPHPRCPCGPHPLPRCPCCPCPLPRCPRSCPLPRCPCLPFPRSRWCRCRSRCSSLLPRCCSPRSHWLNIIIEKNLKDFE